MDYDFSKYGYVSQTYIINGHKVTRHHKKKKEISIKALVKKLRKSGFPLDKQQLSIVKDCCKAMMKKK